MKTIKPLFLYLLLVAGTIVIYNTTGCSSNEKTPEEIALEKEENKLSADNFKSEIRKLLDEHLFWTRNLLFCEIDSLPGKEQVLKRLLKNQNDIGEALEPFYGTNTASEFTNLLYPHVLIYIEVIEAEKSGDATAREDAISEWYANAAEIALFLSRLNPDWKQEDIQTLMTDHLKLKEDVVCQRILKNYEADITVSDQLHKQLLIMADLFSSAIIVGFPEKFEHLN